MNNFGRAVVLKLLSMFFGGIMSTLVRLATQELPTGQVVFFRAAFAIIPALAIFALRGELKSAVFTTRPLGHVGRGLIACGSMSMIYGSLARLPVVDATALNFAAPLFTVALAALVLKERVRIHRWSAVVVGFAGIIVMLFPHLNFGDITGDLSSSAALGVGMALLGALFGAASIIQTRRLTATESTSSIVFYFSLFSTVFVLPWLLLVWTPMTLRQWALVISIGLIGSSGQLLMTASYRYAAASAIAPFDYTQLFWVFVFGYFLFGELPTAYVLIGTAIVVLAGLYVIWRERQLGLRSAREAEVPPT